MNLVDNILPRDGHVCYSSNVFIRPWAKYQGIMDSARFEPAVLQSKNGPVHLNYQTASIGNLPGLQSFNSIDYLLDMSNYLEDAIHSLTPFNHISINKYNTGSNSRRLLPYKIEELVENSVIAVVYLGTNRKVIFQHKSAKDYVQRSVFNNSVHVIKHGNNWRHFIPKANTATDVLLEIVFTTRRTA